MVCVAVNGPAVVSVLTTETSAAGLSVPPLPVVSVLLEGSGSGSLAETVALLSNVSAALIVAVTGVVTFAPAARLAVVDGSAAQPPPLELGVGGVVGGGG